jgi:hypothetical protein
VSFPVSWDYEPYQARASDTEFAVAVVRAGVSAIRERGIKLSAALTIAAARYGISERRTRQLYENVGAYREPTRQEIGWLRAGQAALARSTADWHRRRAEYWARVADAEEAAGKQLAIREVLEWQQRKTATTKPDAPGYAPRRAA